MTALQLLGQCCCSINSQADCYLSFTICTKVNSVAKILANKDLVIWINWVITITNIQNLQQLLLKLMAKLPLQ